MKARILIIFLLAAVTVFSACNSLATQSNPPVGAGQAESKDCADDNLDVVTSTADDNESREYFPEPQPPKEITDEIRADAEKTYLETDKNTYGWNDTVKFRIITVSETAYVTYGHGFDIEAWDEENGEWVKANADYAYHQGTAWPWLAGFYFEAYLKIYKMSALGFIERHLIGFEDEMTSHCIGSIPEVFDGNPPFKGRGAVSFAMNVAEILRTLNLLSKYNY